MQWVRQCICMHPSFSLLNQRCVALCYTHTESICISISCWLHHLTAHTMHCNNQINTTTWLLALETAQLPKCLSSCARRHSIGAAADGRERRNYLLLLRILESPHVNLCSDASLLCCDKSRPSSAFAMSLWDSWLRLIEHLTTQNCFNFQHFSSHKCAFLPDEFLRLRSLCSFSFCELSREAKMTASHDWKCQKVTRVWH